MKNLLLSSFLVLLLGDIGWAQSITVNGTGCIEDICIGTYSDTPIDNVYEYFTFNGNGSNIKNFYGVNSTSNLLLIGFRITQWEIYDGCSGETFFTNPTFANSMVPPATGWSTGQGACTGAPAPTLSGDVVLPVELTSFKVSTLKKGIQLYWSTASELDNAGFEIQHLAAGQAGNTNDKDWITLNFVKGHGTTLEAQEYTWLDENPVVGENYYRLKQVDFDGAYEYSPVEVVIWGGNGKDSPLKILPNPARDWIAPVLPANFTTDKAIIFELYDINGRFVQTFTETATSEGIRIDVTDISTGIYVLRTQNDGIVYNTRFTKTK